MSNIRHIVQVNRVKLDPAIALSGIPQGSVLGPMRFVILINDFTEIVKLDTYLFADDTKIFPQITIKKDSLQLQSDINALEESSQKWLLTFDLKKSFHNVLKLEKFYHIIHTELYTLHRQEQWKVFE